MDAVCVCVCVVLSGVWQAGFSTCDEGTYGEVRLAGMWNSASYL
jgi:hypothetical protein